MLKSWTARVLFAGVIGIAPVAMLSLPAVAAPSATPNGWIGACNMMQAWPGVGNVPDGGGMMNAMTRNNPNGNAGMFRAVANTGGVCG